MNKYNWKEDAENCRKNKNPLKNKNPFESLSRVERVQIKPLKDATKVLYNGDLDKYFADVKECDIGTQLINVLCDMYEEIKQLRSIINKDENNK